MGVGIGFLLRMSSYRALSFEGQEVRVVRLGVGGGTVESHCTVYVYGNRHRVRVRCLG